MIYGGSTEQSVPKVVQWQTKHTAPGSSVILNNVLATAPKIINQLSPKLKKLYATRNLEVISHQQESRDNDGIIRSKKTKTMDSK